MQKDPSTFLCVPDFMTALQSNILFVAFEPVTRHGRNLLTTKPCNSNPKPQGFNAAISACEQGNAWQQALDVDVLFKLRIEEFQKLSGPM